MDPNTLAEVSGIKSTRRGYIEITIMGEDFDLESYAESITDHLLERDPNLFFHIHWEEDNSE